MNIFVLDSDPVQAAQAHHDVHVRKMLVETVQILCTVAHEQGFADLLKEPYRPTHRHHPHVKWAGATQGNFTWVRHLGTSLLEEYDFRWPRTSDRDPVKYKRCRALLPQLYECEHLLPPGGLQPFQRPRDYESGDPVSAYRRYYNLHKHSDKNGKRIDVWTRRARPFWYDPLLISDDECRRD